MAEKNEAGLAPKMILPDEKDFGPVEREPIDGPAPGTVVGLDTTRWAAALIDLLDKPDRVDAARYRLRNKGYRKIEGEVMVIGYRKPEVWVLPRKKFEARRAAQRDRFRELVRAGRMSDAALRVPHVQLTGRDGISIPQD